MARQYFGFDENFLDDKKICADIEQLRFTKEFSFLDEFFNQGSGGAVSNCAGGGVECFLKAPAGDDTIPCNGAKGGKAWRVVNTVFRQRSAVAKDAFEIIDAICPDDALSKAFGCSASEAAAYTVYVVTRLVSILP
jgi:hypothetical protein